MTLEEIQNKALSMKIDIQDKNKIDLIHAIQKAEGMTNQEQLAYLAGLLDGEGTIYIELNKIRNRYCPAISIANNNKSVLYWCKLLFGGNVCSRSNRKISQWRLHDKNALLLIKELLPYLKIKKQEAKKFLDYIPTYTFPKHGNFHLKTPDYIQYQRAKIKQDLQNLRCGHGANQTKSS